jgi:myo-inositol-1(or 4)-monophosphatase
MEAFSHELLHVATIAARAGGDLAMRYFADLATLTFEEKPGRKNAAADLVSVADREVEATLRRVIAAHRPTDGFLGEESGRTTGVASITWVADPIDGTLNFAYGRPGFALSLAAVDSTGPVAAVVLDPVLDKLYTAVRGAGAWCNGSRLTVRPIPDLAHALVEVGRGRGAIRARFPHVLTALDTTVRDIRRGGSAALALASLAAGECDAVYGPGLEPWDMAAGVLIAREAGALVSNAAGAEPDGETLVASTPAVFETFRALVAAALHEATP